MQWQLSTPIILMQTLKSNEEWYNMWTWLDTQKMDGLCYVINALNYDSNVKFTKLCTIDCTLNNLSLNYDSGTENTAFLQIFAKNSTKN